MGFSCICAVKNTEDQKKSSLFQIDGEKVHNNYKIMSTPDKKKDHVNRLFETVVDDFGELKKLKAQDLKCLKLLR